jgi:hypothetical protein
MKNESRVINKIEFTFREIEVMALLINGKNPQDLRTCLENALGIFEAIYWKNYEFTKILRLRKLEICTVAYLNLIVFNLIISINVDRT